MPYRRREHAEAVKVTVQDQALRLASQITHPVTVAVFAAVLAASAFIFALRSKRPRVAWVLAVGIIVLGLAPLAAQAISQWRGIYHVRVIVLGPTHSPVDDARIVSSAGGESKRVQGGWEIDIPAQTRPVRGADLAQQALHAADGEVEIDGKGGAQMLKHLVAFGGLVF